MQAMTEREEHKEIERVVREAGLTCLGHVLQRGGVVRQPVPLLAIANPGLGESGRCREREGRVLELEVDFVSAHASDTGRPRADSGGRARSKTNRDRDVAGESNRSGKRTGSHAEFGISDSDG